MTSPGFGPLDIPPGSGPLLDSDKPWFRRPLLWLLVLAAALGALLVR